jgi:NitT/TauT family transport system substrate-binding protein
MAIDASVPEAGRSAAGRDGMTRRGLMRRVAGVGVSAAALAAFGGCRRGSESSVTAAAEGPPETNQLRLKRPPSICTASYYVAAEELLAGEGFTDLQFVTRATGARLLESLAAHEIDIAMSYGAQFMIGVDAGLPIVVLAGVHVGCFELFATGDVRTVRDLKGKRVAVPEIGAAHYLFASSIVAHVGLDPRRDIAWAVHPPDEAKQLLVDGAVDAFIGFPPDPQELRARKVGHVVVNSALDRPWSQYFCCYILANREFVRRNPVATKRALRAFLKAADICAAEPERAARLIVDRGYTPSYEYTSQTLKELPYDKWRQYDHEDTLRFYALRFQQARLVKNSPRRLIERGTDWRFLNELKKELKG